MNQYEALTTEEWQRIRLLRGLVTIAVLGGVAVFLSLRQAHFVAALVVFLLLESIGFFLFPWWLVETYAPFVLRCPECRHEFEVPTFRFLFSCVAVSPLRLLAGGTGWVLYRCPRCGEESRKTWMKKTG